MRRNWVRFALVAGLLGITTGLAQNATPALDPELAGDFLKAISSYPVTPAGQAKALETLGITEGELSAMRKLSAAISAMQSAYFTQVRSLTMESRLQSIQHGKVEGWVTEKLEQLEKQKDAALAARLSGLREILGDARLEKLSQYIQAEAPDFRGLDDRPQRAVVPASPGMKKL